MSSARLWFVVVGLSLLCLTVYSLQSRIGLERLVTESTSEALSPQETLAIEVGQDEKLVAVVRGLRKAVTLLESRVAFLEARQTAQPSAALPDGATVDMATAADQTRPLLEDDPDSFAFDEREQTRWEQYLDLIETSLQDEQVDDQWSSRVQAEIEQILTKEELNGASVTDIECRTIICRIEVIHDDPQGTAGFDALLLHNLANILPNAVIDKVESDNGGVTAVIYLARDSYEIPLPEE